MDPAHWVEDDSGTMFAPGFGPGTKSPAASGSARQSSGDRQIRVLLVEDSLVDARMVQLTLKQIAGVTFEVVTVATLSAAVEQLGTSGFQLVLLDLGLPDSSGLDTFCKLFERASAIPIIVLTGNADEDLAIQAIRQGAQDYLVKGADAVTLTRTIRYALSRHKMRLKIQRALDAMKVIEANLRTIIDKNLDCIVVVDQAALVVHANAAAEALFAYRTGTFVGQRFPLPVNPGVTQVTDIVNCLSQVVPTELRFVPIDWDGQPACLVLLRDLTERRQAESNRHKLELAREVQQGLLPRDRPHLDGFDFAGASVTADETGGDYFDYVPMPDGAIGVVVADASGHGISAALVITVVSTSLRAFGSLTSDPGEVLRRVAQLLHPSLVGGHFVTAVLARIDPVRRTIVYANAGHPSAILIDSAGQVRAELASLNLPIGIDDDHRFQSSPVTPLHPGDTLVLISDGIVESMRHDRTLFGKTRVIELVRQHRGEPAQVIVEKLIHAVRSQCAPQSPGDDLTAVVVKLA